MHQIDILFKDLVSKNRRALSKAITLVESNLISDSEYSQQLLQLCLEKKSESLRIGISGIPGVGKSTFIDTFGSFLCKSGKSIAVLAVDPTSSISKGSILGDKTRMSELSQYNSSFIRPSPSGGSLGGVTRKMRETILLCEAAGFDYIFIETVGVGQNEITVRSMTDLFILLMITGAGDELQGFKRGITEISDIILVNKADGENVIKSKLTETEYSRAIKFLSASTKGWSTIVTTFSSIDSSDCNDLYSEIKNFELNIRNSSMFSFRRKEQELNWFDDLLQKEVLTNFFNSKNNHELIHNIRQQINNGTITATFAVQLLFRNI